MLRYWTRFAAWCLLGVTAAVSAALLLGVLEKPLTTLLYTPQHFSSGILLARAPAITAFLAVVLLLDLVFQKLPVLQRAPGLAALALTVLVFVAIPLLANQRLQSQALTFAADDTELGGRTASGVNLILPTRRGQSHCYDLCQWYLARNPDAKVSILPEADHGTALTLNADTPTYELTPKGNRLQCYNKFSKAVLIPDEDIQHAEREQGLCVTETTAPKHADLRLILAQTEAPHDRIDATLQVRLVMGSQTGPKLAFQRSSFIYSPMETPLTLARLESRSGMPKVVLRPSILKPIAAIKSEINGTRTHKEVLAAAVP